MSENEMKIVHPQSLEQMKPGVATMMEVQANLDAAHECKWKSLAVELMAYLEQATYALKDANERTNLWTATSHFDRAIAKAREAGL